MKYREILCGDSAVIFKAGDDISTETNRLVRGMLMLLENNPAEGIVDYIPSYNELMVCFDPAITGHDRIISHFRSLGDNVDTIVQPPAETVRIPVLYGGDAGPDIGEVAAAGRLSEEEVIAIHSGVSYYVYMLGFTPGFCYLGGMDERIAVPRRKTPRLVIPAGSVGIAGSQTGIYPVASPGGWQLIGKTPVRLFNDHRDPVFLVSQGDMVRFYPVDADEYRRIEVMADNNTWVAERIKNS